MHTMKPALLLLSLFAGTTAFQVAKSLERGVPSLRLRSSVDKELDAGASPSIEVSATLAKTALLETAQSLNSEFGCLIIDSKAQDRLKDAVEKLEAVSEAPTESALLIGNWTLLCSTASASLQGPLDKINGIDTSKLPFFNQGPLKEIRDTLNKSLKVQQLVKSETSPGIIDRVDHVLQYEPPSKLADFVSSIPDTLKNLNINPLQVSQSKVILVHKAQVESISPLNTKLSLSSIIVNVAGKSQVLDPDGADVLGVNVPFGEFLNAGAFETTYMDDKIRVSRSKVGIVDQLRVFLKTELEASADDLQKGEEEGDEITDAAIVIDDDDEDEDDDDSSPSDY